MISFDFNEYCCGCGACENICPVNSIKMKEDDAGFSFPVVDKNICINCGKCERVCPHINTEKIINNSNKFINKAWLYTSPDKEVKMRSSSGGAFFELAKKFISDGGVVIGCVWDQELKARHTLVSTDEELKKMQGSKYVQSSLGNSYSNIVSLLKAQKKVLFSGTPCQVSAAHNVVMDLANGCYRENLLTVGIVCHGVSAPNAWESYKTWAERKNGSKLVKVNFRDKSKEGYKKPYCRYEYESGKTIFTPTYLPTSKFIEATLVYNLAIRNSCAHCDCKGINKACDIILGDWHDACTGEGQWGTSCVVTFTERGMNFIERTLYQARVFSYDKVVERNVLISESTKLSPHRDEFLVQMKSIDTWNNVEKFYPPEYIFKRILVKLGIYFIIKRFIG